jgi:hypothetical protein
VYGCGSRVGSCMKRFSIQRQGSEVGWAFAGQIGSCGRGVQGVESRSDSLSSFMPLSLV